MEGYKDIEKSIIKKYRKEIWSRFIKAVKEYELINENDKIMVCISGGKDSFLLAKCIQELKRHGKIPFEAYYVVMDPGYTKENKNLIIVKHDSPDYYKYLSISKYWIVNSIVEEAITKKDNQVYVQCWHGTPLKRLRCDIEVDGSVLNTVEEIRKRNDIDAKRFDYFISPSKFCTEKFTSAFNLKNLNNFDNV